MTRGVLAEAALGAVFFVLPLVLLGACLAWLVLRAAQPVGSAGLGLRLRVALAVARDPLVTALSLVLSGVVLVGFVAGDLGGGAYLGVAGTTLRFLVGNLTDWADVTSSEAISVRGFAFIVLVCCLVVVATMWRYFAARWDTADNEVRRRQL